MQQGKKYKRVRLIVGCFSLLMGLLAVSLSLFYWIDRVGTVFLLGSYSRSVCGIAGLAAVAGGTMTIHENSTRNSEIRSICGISLRVLFIILTLQPTVVYSLLSYSATVTVTPKACEFYYVNQLSNVDSSADKGTHSIFTAQQYGPDLVYDTLTEEDTGEVSKHVYYSTGDETGGGGAWSSYKLCQTFSSSTSFSITSVRLLLHRTGSTATATVGIYATTGNPAYPTGTALTSATGITLASTALWYEIALTAYSLNANTTYAIVVSGSGGNSGNAVYWRCDTTSPTYANGRYGRSLSSGAWGTAQMDNTRDNMFEVWGTSHNYQIDLEEQWTNVDFQEANELLCIYLSSHVGSENLMVDVWNNSAWQNLLTDLSVGWNNVTVSSYLTASNFTIRLKGNIETGDTVRDEWSIDSALLVVRP